nr:MAG TPA: hypothetical protein [Caudoviricetes sp.]
MFTVCSFQGWNNHLSCNVNNLDHIDLACGKFFKVH